MTHAAFLESIQRYYGKYPPGQLPTVQKYLSGKSEKYLGKLYTLVLLDFSSQYRVPPDIAVFERHKIQAIEKLTFDPAPPGTPQITDGMEDHKKEIREMLQELAWIKRVQNASSNFQKRSGIQGALNEKA